MTFTKGNRLGRAWGAQTNLQKRGRNNRRRGQNGERELCALLNEHLGLNTKRLLGQARDGGHDIDIPGHRLEVKRRKKVANLYEWMENLSTSAGGGCCPVLALRADGKPWLVVLNFEDWVRYVRKEVAKG